MDQTEELKPNDTFLPSNVIIGFHTATNEGAYYYRITIHPTSTVIEGNVPQDVMDRIPLPAQTLTSEEVNPEVASEPHLLN